MILDETHLNEREEDGAGEAEGSREIRNLELLDYYAYKLNEIYQFKEYIFFFGSMEKHLLNERRWKSLRNTCVLVLYVGLLFCKPAWCLSEPQVAANCTATLGGEDGRKDFFLVFPHFLDAHNFEIASWFLMLVLILYDLLLVENDSRLVMAYCLLFVLDVLAGFFFLNDVLALKLSPLFRFAFLLAYT